MLSGDGSSVIVGLSDGSLRRWDVATGKEHPIGQPTGDIDRAFFSRDGRSAALIGHGSLYVVDLAGGGLRFQEPAGTMTGEFSPDCQSLTIVREGRGKETKLADGRLYHDSSTAASTIAWLDSQTGHVRREFDVPESSVYSLAFSPDGQTIAAGTSFHWERGIIRIFRLRDKREIQTIETPCPWIRGLSFTPDGKQIVAGLSDTSIVIWDVRPTD